MARMAIANCGSIVGRSLSPATEIDHPLVVSRYLRTKIPFDKSQYWQPCSRNVGLGFMTRTGQAYSVIWSNYHAAGEIRHRCILLPIAGSAGALETVKPALLTLLYASDAHDATRKGHAGEDRI
jgi:hypothetical protein